MAVKTDYTAEGGVWNQRYLWWEWYDDQGQPHRVDGPAVFLADGTQQWYLHGTLHRADGPAFVGACGSRAWWFHGRRHRVDGPAWIGDDGRQEWWVCGCNITAEVEAWMRDGGIAPPFTPEQQAEFALRWL